MANYTLHYAGTDIPLDDAQAAVMLIAKIDRIHKAGLGGRLSVHTAQGTVFIYVGPTTPIAVSGLSPSDVAALD